MRLDINISDVIVELLESASDAHMADLLQGLSARRFAGHRETEEHADALHRAARHLRDRHETAAKRGLRRYYCMFCPGVTRAEPPTDTCQSPWEHTRDDLTPYVSPPVRASRAPWAARSLAEDLAGASWFSSARGEGEGDDERIIVECYWPPPEGAVPSKHEGCLVAVVPRGGAR